jgi:hypothetical protein
MRPNNTDSLITAAHRRRELTRAKAIQTIRELDHAGTPVTFQAIARASQVSRSWLYSQPDIRAEIERLRDATQQAPSPPIPTSQRASDPSLRQRLTEATQRNRQLAEDNARLRRQLAHALGDQRASPPALHPLPGGTQPVTLKYPNDPAN